MNKYFKTPKLAYRYLEKNSSKYNNLSLAAKEDTKIRSITYCVELGLLDKNKVYSYFGGMKRIQKIGKMLTRDFSNEKEVYNYLSQECSKYKTFQDARIDPKINRIASLVARGLISRDKVYSFWRSSRRRLRTRISDIQFLKYLQEAAENYSSFGNFRRNDHKGDSFHNLLRNSKKHLNKQVKEIVWKKQSNIIRKEKQIQEKLFNLLSSLYNNVHMEYRLPIKSKERIDIFIKLKNNKYLFIEIKDDSARWSNKKICEQISRYSQIGQEMFEKDFVGCVLCSPKGKYGISFTALFEYIKLISKK